MKDRQEESKKGDRKSKQMKEKTGEKIRKGQIDSLCSRGAKKNTPKTADVGRRKVRVGQRKCTK